MIRRIVMIGILVVLSATVPAATNAKTELTFEQKTGGLKLLRSTFDPTIAGGADQEYVRTFDRYFGKDLNREYVSTLGTRQRVELFELTMLASWSASHLRYLEFAQLILEEMLREREASRTYVELVVHELMSKRQFEAAARLASHAGLPAPPAFTIEDFHSPRVTTPTTLHLTGNSRRLARKHLDVLDRAKVVVLSSPTCPHCRSAAQAISNDPFLKQFFAQHSEWVLPTNAPLDYDALLQWSHQYPHLRYSLMFDAAEWPGSYGVITAATPTFFIFENGILKTKLVGWPDDQSTAKQRLTSALERSGHVPTTSRTRQ